MRNFLIGLALCCLAEVNCERVEAGLVFANEITGADPGLSNPFTSGQLFDANVTVSGIGRSAGVGGFAADDRYNTNGWSTTFSTDDYFTFSITPKANYEISFTDVQVRIQRGHVSIDNFSLRSSRDNFTANIGSLSYTGTTGNASATLNSVGLLGAPFQNVTDSIEFRLYAWGADQNSRTFSVNDFSFNGSVTAVPEPSSVVLLGVASLFGVALGKIRNRKRHSQTETMAQRPYESGI